MITAIGLGSNLRSSWGEPADAVAEAVRRMGALGKVVAVSTLRETVPVGVVEQPMFTNGALLLETALTPVELMQALLRTELEMGRVRDGVAAKGPRVMDLDLLLYDNTVLSTSELSLPHPAMHLRAFVLEPMAEIAPGMVHPVFGKTMRVLLGEMRDRASAAGGGTVQQG